MATVRKRKWTHNGTEREAWVVAYTDQGGKRRIKTFDKKKEADAFRTKVEGEVRDKLHVPDSQTLTVSDLCDRYYRNCEERTRDGRLGKAYLKNVRMAIDNSIKPHLGAVKINALEAEHVNDFYQAMTRQDKLRPVTARKRLGVLGQMEDFAFRRKYTRVRSVAEASKDFRGIGVARVRTFTKQQIADLLRTAETRGKWVMPRSVDMLRCYIHLATFCGLRWGEITGLSRGHLDLEAGIILVRHSFSEVDGLKSPKTRAGVRDVPLPSHIVVLLRDWLQRHFLSNEADLVFANVNGNAMSAANFHNLMWKPVLKRAGLAPAEGQDWLRFHALRHFAASWMIDQGFSLPDTASLLGHNSFDTTLQIYAHPIVNGSHSNRAMESAAQKLLSHSPIIDATTI